jgi:hypothetical protein
MPLVVDLASPVLPRPEPIRAVMVLVVASPAATIAARTGTPASSMAAEDEPKEAEEQEQEEEEAKEVEQSTAEAPTPTPAPEGADDGRICRSGGPGGAGTVW